MKGVTMAAESPRFPSSQIASFSPVEEHARKLRDSDIQQSPPKSLVYPSNTSIFNRAVSSETTTRAEPSSGTYMETSLGSIPSVESLLRSETSEDLRRKPELVVLQSMPTDFFLRSDSALLPGSSLPILTESCSEGILGPQGSYDLATLSSELHNEAENELLGSATAVQGGFHGEAGTEQQNYPASDKTGQDAQEGTGLVLIYLVPTRENEEVKLNRQKLETIISKIVPVENIVFSENYRYAFVSTRTAADAEKVANSLNVFQYEGRECRCTLSFGHGHAQFLDLLEPSKNSPSTVASENKKSPSISLEKQTQQRSQGTSLSPSTHAGVASVRPFVFPSMPLNPVVQEEYYASMQCRSPPVMGYRSQRAPPITVMHAQVPVYPEPPRPQWNIVQGLGRPNFFQPMPLPSVVDTPPYCHDNDNLHKQRWQDSMPQRRRDPPSGSNGRNRQQPGNRSATSPNNRWQVGDCLRLPPPSACRAVLDYVQNSFEEQMSECPQLMQFIRSRQHEQLSDSVVLVSVTPLVPLFNMLTQLLEQNNVVVQKWTARYIIPIPPDTTFEVTRKIIGSQGMNMKRIYRLTGCKLRLRGRGSWHREGECDSEANEPLHLCVSCHTEERLYRLARFLVEELLIDIVCQYYMFLLRQGKTPIGCYPTVVKEILIPVKNRSSPVITMPLELPTFSSENDLQAVPKFLGSLRSKNA